MKKSQEQKKLDDFEDKLLKLDSYLIDLRQKYSTEKEEIERLKIQIQHMESAMKNKDQDLGKIKTDLQIITSEQASLEARVISRKELLFDLNSNLESVNFELTKVS
jgi:chromosome segregation ATPase